MTHNRERMVRRWKSLSAQTVQEKIDSSTPEKYATGGLAHGEYMPPFSEKLVGKKYSFTFDEDNFQYEFIALHELVWTQDAISHEEYYQGHESDEPGIFLVQHMVKGTSPAQCRTIVIDTNTGLVTMCRAHFGNESEAREVSRRFTFGKIDGYDSYPDEKHHFTSDLVGTAIKWVYHEKFPAIKHIYSTEYYYTYVMSMGEKCWVASNPADFVKINDHIYIFSFVEERQAGSQGFFLINMNTLHDVGHFLGINSNDEFESYTVGAKGSLSTMETYLDGEKE